MQPLALGCRSDLPYIPRPLGNHRMAPSLTSACHATLLLSIYIPPPSFICGSLYLAATN